VGDTVARPFSLSSDASPRSDGGSVGRREDLFSGLMRDALHLPSDQELPSCWCRAIFQDRKQSWNSPVHAVRLANLLQVLDFAKSPADMNLPGWDLHKLAGDLRGHWAVKVSGNWRLTFAFEGEDAILVDYQDYH